MNPAVSNVVFPFPLLGEPLSLDLVNTRIRKDGAEVDLLDKPAALTAWLAAESDRHPYSGHATTADLKAVRAIRDAIAALLAARREGKRPTKKALRAVNDVLSTSAPAMKLIWTSAGLRPKPQAAARKRDALLHALAMDAARLLTGPQADLLRVCEHPDCVLQFLALDPRRRWCSASVCGNRARVARHYRLHRADA